MLRGQLLPQTSTPLGKYFNKQLVALGNRLQPQRSLHPKNGVRKIAVGVKLRYMYTRTLHVKHQQLSTSLMSSRVLGHTVVTGTRRLNSTEFRTRSFAGSRHRDEFAEAVRDFPVWHSFRSRDGLPGRVHLRGNDARWRRLLARCR
jgi:hypothetical protein